MKHLYIYIYVCVCVCVYMHSLVTKSHVLLFLALFTPWKKTIPKTNGCNVVENTLRILVNIYNIEEKF
jgi:hypothetical protein